MVCSQQASSITEQVQAGKNKKHMTQVFDGKIAVQNAFSITSWRCLSMMVEFEKLREQQIEYGSVELVHE